MHVHADSEPPAEWDEYVRRHPDATAYHFSACARIGARAFGLRTAFITAHGAGGLVGVLPVVQQSSVLFGRFLVSLPFFTYGGILADDQAVAEALASKAADLAKEWRCDHVEFRHSAPMPDLQLAERLDKVSMMLDLPSSEEDLARRLGSKLRSQIRRADRLQPEVVWGGSELLAEFYRVFAVSMHSLGTPVYPRSFFDVACEQFGDLARIVVVRVNGAVEAAAFLVWHGRRIEVPWAAATSYAKRTSVNMRMYWEMLRFAIENHAEVFDFGRSSVDSGTYRFKAQWGATPRQLHWHYWLSPGRAVPQLNNANPKYALASAIWKRLPLWSANLIGPRIARHIP